MYQIDSLKVNLIITGLLLVGSLIMVLMTLENDNGLIACLIGLWCIYLIYGIIGNIVVYVKGKRLR